MELKKQIVVVGILGGIAYTKECPENITVLFVDYDNLSAAEKLPDGSSDAANCLQKNEPETLRKLEAKR